jgi:hypothetical protein
LTASSAFLSNANFDFEGGSLALESDRIGCAFAFDFFCFSLDVEVDVVGSARRDVRVSPNLFAVVGLLRSGC